MELYDLDRPQVKVNTGEHSTDNVQRCQKCMKAFPTSQQLLQHNLVHSNLRKFPCMYCDKSFKQLSHLQQHQRIHTGERPYRCVIGGCTKAFRQLSSLQQHLKGHSLSNKDPLHKSEVEFGRNEMAPNFPPKPHDLICQICEKQCSNDQRFFKHMNKFHPEYWRVFSGGLPLSSFVAPDTTSSSRDNPFLCSICNKRYIHRTGYVKHLSSHVNRQKDSYPATPAVGIECKICKKVFSKESYLIRHLEMKTDHGHKMALENSKKNALSKSEGDLQLFLRDTYSCPSSSFTISDTYKDTMPSLNGRIRDFQHLPPGDTNSFVTFAHCFPSNPPSDAPRSPETSNRDKYFSPQVYVGGSSLVKNQTYQDHFRFANGLPGPSIPTHADVSPYFHYGAGSLEYCSYQPGITLDPESIHSTMTPFHMPSSEMMDPYLMRTQHFSRYTSFR